MEDTATGRCLINEIPAGERLITIEDTLEIGLEHFAQLHPDLETSEAREANAEGVGVHGAHGAIVALAHGVIVGEVRSGDVFHAPADGVPAALRMGPDRPRLLGGRAWRDASVARTEAIAAWTEMIRDSISAASGLEEAIVATGPVAPRPIRREVAQLLWRVEHGSRVAHRRLTSSLPL